MQVVRYRDAKAYQAPKHFDMRSLRLQGMEASDSKTCWVGLSHFLPGGGAEMDASPVEKIYVVLAGEITIGLEGESVALGPMDSCVLAPDERREIRNDTNEVATMLVILQYPEG